MRKWLFWFLIFGVAACDDGGGSTPSTADAHAPDAAGADAAPAPPDGAVVDAHPPDASPAPDAEIPDAGPPPPAVAPEVEPAPFVVEDWVLGRMGRTDTILPLLEQGRFHVPAPNERFEGVDWLPVTPDASGGIDGLGQGVGYLAARVVVPAPMRLLVRPDRVLEIYVNGVRQPGDVYGDGRMRVPVRLDAGENEVVLRVYGSRGAPSVGFWSTDDEVAFNLADLTVPDLRVDSEAVQWVGVPVLVFGRAAVTEVVARVEASPLFEATALRWPALPGGAVTQVGFELRPRGPMPASDAPVAVTLRLESPDLAFAYTRTVQVAVSSEGAYRRTFLSPDDASVQYYGVQPPPEVDPDQTYSLVLSLHGAGVQGIGQAQAYSPKPWAYLIAPTNRRPFGFDWEEWGRRNGLYALEDAQRAFSIDATRVYLTGHSMGGHGTWHLGVHDAGRFAVVGPSAGWSSFYSYTGRARPTGAVARARAHSETNTYLENLIDKAIYIIHGSADDNVPVSEARAMRDAVSAVTQDVQYHEEPGAGHWWDGDASPGADCVDWPPLFELMQARTVDPQTLDFHFRSPSPAYNSVRSYVTVGSVQTADRDFLLDSQQVGSRVLLTTDNVRSLVLDGDALTARGIEAVEVDGSAVPVAPGPLVVGPTTGKRVGVQGPFNQAFQRPFCYIYPDDVPELADYAAYLASTWTLIGNGHSCALPASRRALAGDRQPIYLGLSPAQIGAVPFDWDDREIRLDGRRYVRSALLFVFDAGDRLGTVITATAGAEYLLYRVTPFSSGAGLPDYLLWSEEGARALGFLDGDWQRALP